MARIDSIDRAASSFVPFTMFSIENSRRSENEIAVIPADIAMCDDCLLEFLDPANPRYRHPFISCANCGPRFSIMSSLPYDRDTTTMSDFPMCSTCSSEYFDPLDRRYHAQTVSCYACGPQALWLDGHLGRSRSVTPIEVAIEAIRGGGVIALKGVGGYYLVCSPFDEGAVSRLRLIKQREQKPFAVMFGSVSSLREYCLVDELEAELLASPERPIVLVEQLPAPDTAAQQRMGIYFKSPQLRFSNFGKLASLRQCQNFAKITAARFVNSSIRQGSALSGACSCSQAEFADGVCNDSRFVGAMLPSMGLQYLLVNELGPLVMTSANVSGLPIIFEEAEMEDLMRRAPLIAGSLYNTRRIMTPMDDSVACVISGKPQMIRRAKGYVPAAIMVQSGFGASADVAAKPQMIFSAGAHLKSVFSLSKGPAVYLSQHFGDLGSFESEQMYESAFFRMKTFFDIEPQIVAYDLHPNYFPTRFAKNYVEGNVVLVPVQHHHAHIASVMAEHSLEEPVIGVAFDGTGYGIDGKIWGGEILICEGAEFERFSHLKYVKMLGGDDSMREGWKSALSHKLASGAVDVCRSEYAERTFEIDLTEIFEYAHACCAHNDGDLELGTGSGSIAAAEAAIRSGIGLVETSSVGRLFDAVASLLGIHHVNRYEGECAIMLENAAQRALDGATNEATSDADQLALLFHRRVAEKVLDECTLARQNYGIDKVCLSGGVFQNRILLDQTERLLSEAGFSVYRNIIVPPNDGGIAFGQNYIAMHA
jgi:hydrogenase maturation protein HypF